MERKGSRSGGWKSLGVRRLAIRHVNEFELAGTLKTEGAYPLEDLFDFENSPSLNTTLTQAARPANDCTPLQLP